MGKQIKAKPVGMIRPAEYIMEDDIQYETTGYAAVAFTVTACAFLVWLINPEDWVCILGTAVAAITDILCILQAQKKIDTKHKVLSERNHLMETGLYGEGHVLSSGSMPVHEGYCKKIRDKYKAAYKAKIEYYNEFTGTEEIWAMGLITCPKAGDSCGVYYEKDGSQYVSFLPRRLR